MKHLTESNFTEIGLAITHYKVFENYIYENTATFRQDYCTMENINIGGYTPQRLLTTYQPLG